MTNKNNASITPTKKKNETKLLIIIIILDFNYIF